MQHRIRPQPLLLLLLESLLQQLVQPLRAGSRIALQLAQHLGRHNGDRITVTVLEFLEGEICKRACHVSGRDRFARLYKTVDDAGSHCKRGWLGRAFRDSPLYRWRSISPSATPTAAAAKLAAAASSHGCLDA